MIMFILLFIFIPLYSFGFEKLLKQIEQDKKEFEIENPKNISNIEWVKKTIDHMVKQDKIIRNVYNKQPNHYLVKLMKHWDEINVQRLKEIITYHGWPTIDTFDKETDLNVG